MIGMDGTMNSINSKMHTGWKTSYAAEKYSSTVNAANTADTHAHSHRRAPPTVENDA